MLKALPIALILSACLSEKGFHKKAAKAWCAMTKKCYEAEFQYDSVSDCVDQFVESAEATINANKADNCNFDRAEARTQVRSELRAVPLHDDGRERRLATKVPPVPPRRAQRP